MYFAPSELKDYAVYIKGTSGLKSAFRASVRDAKNDGGAAIKTFSNRLRTDKKYAKQFEQKLNGFRKYFSGMDNVIIKESAEDTGGTIARNPVSEYSELVQSILEEPMIASSKVFIVNNMMNNTFIGVGYGDDTSIQRLKVDPNISISNKDINNLIDQGIASVYEYIGPDAYAEMCITESADTASVSRDYFRRTYIEVCSKVDAICEVTEATLWGNINTKINPTALSLLGEVTLCPKGALKLPKEFECTSVLETHQDIDGYYLKNPLTEKRSKSRRLGSAVPYYTVKHLLEYKL